MATTEAPSTTTAASHKVRAEQATFKEDLVTAIFGTCLMLGALSDGWAHTNILSQVQQEGFFTLWHGLLYAGLAATGGWTFWLAYRRRDRHPRWWVDGWPAGYKIGAIGVVTFLVAGFCDMLWHEIVGIEAGVDATLSPSHLLLSVGSVVTLTSPLRSWWATGENGRRSITGVWSLALGTMAASIFVMYASAFSSNAPMQPYDPLRGTIGQLVGTGGVVAYLITTALLVVPLLLAHRRRYTPGVATALVFFVALFPMGAGEFPRPQATAALAAVLAAAVVDWILGQLDRVRGFDAPLRLPIAAAVFAAVVWTVHLWTLQLDARVTWGAVLLYGTPLICTLAATMIGGLASRPTDYANR